MVTWSESCSCMDLTRVSWRVKVISFTHYLVRFPYPLVTGYPQACQMGKPDYTIPCKKTRKQILTPPPDDIDFPCPVRSEHEEQMVLISLGWGVQNSFARITLCHQGKVMGTTHVFTSSWSSYFCTLLKFSLFQYCENKIYSAIMFFAFQIETAAIEASVILNSRLSGS